MASIVERHAAHLDRLRDPSWLLACLAAFSRLLEARFDLAAMGKTAR